MGLRRTAHWQGIDTKGRRRPYADIAWSAQLKETLSKLLARTLTWTEHQWLVDRWGHVLPSCAGHAVGTVQSRGNVRSVAAARHNTWIASSPMPGNLTRNTA